MPVHGTFGLSALQPSNRATARNRLMAGLACVGFTSALSAPALDYYGRKTRRKLNAQVRRLRRKK